MAYTKTVWKDRIVATPTKYKDQANVEYTFTPVPGEITEAGTPVNAANLNKLEDAVVDVTQRVDTETFQTASYMALVTNANTASLDAAFGKGNINYIRDLGKQLAMLACYFDGALELSDFPNLVTYHNLIDIMNDPQAVNSIIDNADITTKCLASPYAYAYMKGKIPMTLASTQAVIAHSQVYTSSVTCTGGVLTTVGELTNLAYSGVFWVDMRAYGTVEDGTAYLYRNGVQISSVSILTTGVSGAQNRMRSISFGAHRFLAGDTVTVKVTAVTTKSIAQRCLMMFADRPVNYPATPTLGSNLIWASSVPARSTGPMSTDAFTAPYTGTYRFYVQTYSPFDLNIIVNGGNVGTATKNGTFDRSLTAGDTIFLRTIGLDSSTNSNDLYPNLVIFAVGMATQVNTYPVS